MEIFYNYDWPGNVRELKNLIEMAFHASKGKIDLAAHLYLGRLRDTGNRAEPHYTADKPFKVAKRQLVGDFEREYVRQILEKNGWNISKAAREAEIERAYLQRLIKKYGLTS